MNEEIRLVTRQETFNDLAVRELAKGRSACICRLQFGRCTKDECKTCQVGQQYWNCYNAMTDYDRQRLSSYVSEQYLEDSRYPDQWMRYQQMVSYTLKRVIGFFVGFILIVGLMFLMLGPADKPEGGVSDETNTQIIECMRRAHSQVYDMNNDGKVNCIDYSVMFKVTWDQMYPELKYRCEIVRNLNLPKMNHLFIRVRDGWRDYVEVEPWCEDPVRYRMSDNWSVSYDPKHNIYGETSRWVSKCGVN